MSFTPAQVMARLKATARDAGPRGTDPYRAAPATRSAGYLGCARSGRILMSSAARSASVMLSAISIP